MECRFPCAHPAVPSYTCYLQVSDSFAECWSEIASGLPRAPGVIVRGAGPIQLRMLLRNGLRSMTPGADSDSCLSVLSSLLTSHVRHAPYRCFRYHQHQPSL